MKVSTADLKRAIALSYPIERIAADLLDALRELEAVTLAYHRLHQSWIRFAWMLETVFGITPRELSERYQEVTHAQRGSGEGISES